MAEIDVRIKHGGNQHPVRVDIMSPPSAFKKSIEKVTGVPAERMKVMVKGGILKDDAVMAQLGLKQDQVVTVIGSSTALPPAPEKPVFVEDMDEASVPNQDRDPVGLINLGQTCYLNSSLQALRQIPPLQQALAEYHSDSRDPEAGFTTSLRNLLSGLERTSDPVPPLALLNQLRSLAPQFAEMDPSGRGFAQQDADEVWTQIISALRSTLRAPGGSNAVVDECMSIELTKILSCQETPAEPPTTSREQVLKLECNISIATNFLLSGILDSLDQSIEKNSPTLGRMANYNQQCRLSRLPEYLTIHMVRFYWRRDIQKKAKIMRKVKYPLQFDASDLVTDNLRAQSRPLNAFMKTMMQNRDDRAKQLKTARDRAQAILEDRDQRVKEREQFESLVKDNPMVDHGSNGSCMYELCAMVTHKGASADSGHYIGWARKEGGTKKPSGEEEWYKFDDDKVSTVTADKILAMDGGGQDSVAYILLYRAVKP